MDLPTRPTKREGNPHARGFEGDSVDLYAMPPAELRRLTAECILRHIPPGYIEELQVAEKSEREILTRIVGEAAYKGPSVKRESRRAPATGNLATTEYRHHQQKRDRERHSNEERCRLVAASRSPDHSQHLPL
jgi:hypothetical protein